MASRKNTPRGSTPNSIPELEEGDGASVTPPKSVHDTLPERISLPPLQLGRCVIHLEGTSPLIMHAWSHKAKEQILNKQMKRAVAGGTAGKEPRDPDRDYLESMHLRPSTQQTEPMPDFRSKPFKYDGDPTKLKVCFPAIAFKAAGVDACDKSAGFAKTEARASFHIEGEMVDIEGDGPHKREDMVRIGMGTSDLRYRAEMRTWSAKLVINYNRNRISPEVLGNIFNTAGYGVGIGEWRPQKDGQNGRFRVARVEELKD